MATGRDLRLQNIYVDDEWLSNAGWPPSKMDAAQDVVDLMKRYPEDTSFFIDCWTWVGAVRARDNYDDDQLLTVPLYLLARGLRKSFSQSGRRCGTPQAKERAYMSTPINGRCTPSPAIAPSPSSPRPPLQLVSTPASALRNATTCGKMRA